VGPDGITSFNVVQLASDSGDAAALVFFLFDLLYLAGEDLCPRPLIERKTRLAVLLSNASSSLHYSDHQIGHGRAFHERACASSLEGIVSKRIDAAYAPGKSRPLAQCQVLAPRGVRSRWAGPIPKVRGLFSVPCCSVIIIRTDV
jgi:ATP-dependent DNA ligase